MDRQIDFFPLYYGNAVIALIHQLQRGMKIRIMVMPGNVAIGL